MVGGLTPRYNRKREEKKQQIMSTDVSSSQTQSSPSSSEPKPKKQRTPAQLAALAKGREAQKQKAMSAGVVRDDESANELVERVRNSDPEATVSSRAGQKRKDPGWIDSDSSSSSSSTNMMLKVAGVAAVAGLAFLGSKGVFSKGFPVSTPPNTPPQQAETGGTNPMNTGQPNGLGASATVSLSGAPYVP